jgi:Mg2+ and Co2+ transporter CorA
MQEAIRRAETLRSPNRKLAKASTYDEMLIRAHLSTSTVSLHVRRTLDQSFYHNIDTESRDQDQVVYRYQTKGKPLDECDPKIVMVDQLWMWILGANLILTAFPQRWQQPRNDPLNVLDSIIEDINSKTRDPVTSVYDLAMIITNRCSGVFDRHRVGDEEYQFLDMFETSIGNSTDRESVLFKEFNQASAQASEWLQYHRRPGRLARVIDGDQSAARGHEEQCGEWDEKFKFEDYMRGPLFVDKLLDIGQETDLLAETKDIRDELNMIAKVFEDQQHVLMELEAAICDIYFEEQQSQRGVKKRFREQLKTIDMHLKDIERMDKQAERIYSSITDMLDLKQKHANAFEARFARDQAAGTAKQSQIIMVFTIVTIVFLPLSFIAAFFAINIEEFPRNSDGSTNLPLGYVSKYMFGIGFAVSIPLIVIALVLDDIKDVFWHAKKRMAKLWTRALPMGNEAFNSSDSTLNALKLEQMLSSTRSMRRSVDHQWISERLSRETARTRREKVTGFRMRVSKDIERGA